MVDGGQTGVTLHRFFLPSEYLRSDRVDFPREQAHQIRHVLRLQPGQQVIALTGKAEELIVRLEAVAGEVWGTVEERRRNEAEPLTNVVLYQALLKAAKFELILQKCTEIGIAGFVPVTTTRSIPAEPSPSRQRRFETIVREAVEQSRRGRLPHVEPSRPWKAAIEQAVRQGPALLLWEGDAGQHLTQVALPRGGIVSLLVGPEGGFTEEEVAQSVEAGIQPVTLGPRILRAETAAIVGTALLLAQLGELG